MTGVPGRATTGGEVRFRSARARTALGFSASVEQLSTASAAVLGWGGTVLGEPGFLNYCEQEPCHPDDPAASDPAYLATTGGLLLSEDGGRTWHEVAGTTGR